MSLPTRFRTCIRNRPAELPALLAEARRFGESHRLGPSSLYLLELAIEELVTNVVKYGYDDANEHPIRIGIDLQPDHLLLTVEDDGHPFNPLERDPPDTTKPPEERTIGGLGLHMVRKMSEQMEYRRQGDANVVTVRIRRETDG